jgi:hypothetical protein
MAPPLTGKSLILHPPTEGYGPMKRILCSLLVAAVPLGGALADAPKEKNAKVTLVYPARVAERSRLEHQGRARRIRPGRLLGRPHAVRAEMEILPR